MEKLTIEKINENLASVLADIQTLIDNKDIEGMRKVLVEIQELVQDQTEVRLDEYVSDSQKYDHSLHELLSKISGVIEIAGIEGTDPVPADISDLLEKKKELEDKLKASRAQRSRNTREANKIQPQDVTEDVKIEGVPKKVIQDRIDELKKPIDDLGPVTTTVETNPVEGLEPDDYTRMGDNLSDAEIIRNILQNELHLSEEEINATIGQYSLRQYDNGARDITLRQLVRTVTKYTHPVTQKVKVIDESTLLGGYERDELINILSKEPYNISSKEPYNMSEEDIEANISTYHIRRDEDNNWALYHDEPVELTPEQVATRENNQPLIDMLQGLLDKSNPDVDYVTIEEIENTRNELIAQRDAVPFQTIEPDLSAYTPEQIARYEEILKARANIENPNQDVSSIPSAAEQNSQLEAARAKLQADEKARQDIVRQITELRDMDPRPADYEDQVFYFNTARIQLTAQIDEDRKNIEGLQNILLGLSEEELQKIVNDGAEPEEEPAVELTDEDRTNFNTLLQWMDDTVKEVKRVNDEYKYPEEDRNQLESVRQLLLRARDQEFITPAQMRKLGKDFVDVGENPTSIQEFLELNRETLAGIKAQAVIHDMNDIINNENGVSQEDKDKFAAMRDILVSNQRYLTIEMQEQIYSAFTTTENMQDLETQTKDVFDQIRKNQQERELNAARVNEAKEILAALQYARDKEPKKEYTPENAAKVAGFNALIAEIDSIEEKKQEYTIQRTRPGTLSPEEQARKDALLAENERLRAEESEIKSQIVEIDRQIGERKDVPGTPGKPGERLDVTHEVEGIGNNLFGAHKIREALRSREDFTPEEFLRFNQDGLQACVDQLQGLSDRYEEIKNQLQAIFSDQEEGRNLREEFSRAKDEEDPANYIELANKIRENMISATDLNIDAMPEEDREWLRNGVTTKDQADKMTAIVEEYVLRKSAEIEIIRESANDLQESKQIFDREITLIKNEMQTIKMAEGNEEELQEELDAEKERRAHQIEATMYGDEEYDDEREEFNQAFDRFYAAKEAGKNKGLLSYTDKDGAQHEVRYDTLQEYADNEHKLDTDIHTLNLNKYKQYLEITSILSKTDDPEAFKALYPEEYTKYMENPEGYLAEAGHYMDTYHGQINEHKVRYETLKTSGTTLRDMKPVFSGELSTGDKVKNGISNAFRFLGVRLPKFSVEDVNGNKKSNIIGGLATLAGDGLVVGGLTAAVVLGPAGPAVAAATLGVSYGVRGAIIGVRKFQAHREYKKYKEEIDSNRPNLRAATGPEKREARKDEYQKQGDGRLKAWFKATIRDTLSKDRRTETEADIVNRRVAESDAEIDRNAQEAIAKAKAQVEAARKNMETRNANYRTEANSQQVYNYIVANVGQFMQNGELIPDAIEKAEAIIARNSEKHAFQGNVILSDVTDPDRDEIIETVDGMQLHGEELGDGVSSTKYTKPDGEYKQTEEIGEIDAEKDTVAIATATEKNKLDASAHTIDRHNRIAQILGTIAGKMAINGVATHFKTLEDVTKTGTRERTIHHDAEYQDVQVQVGTKPDGYETTGSLTDAVNGNVGKTVTGYYSVSGGETRPQNYVINASDRITAMWHDDGTQWGTGVGDQFGLTAPELVDRTVGSGMMDGSGVLNQGLTMDQLIQACGNGSIDTQTLNGVYVSVSDKCWVKLSDLLTQTKGEPIYEMQHQLVKDAWDEVKKITYTYTEKENVFHIENIVKAGLEGAAAGAGMAYGEALQEAGSPTDRDATGEEKVHRGTFEKIADKLISKITRRTRQEEREDDFEEDFEEEQPEEEHPNEEQPEEEHDDDEQDR